MPQKDNSTPNTPISALKSEWKSKTAILAFDAALLATVLGSGYIAYNGLKKANICDHTGHKIVQTENGGHFFIDPAADGSSHYKNGADDLKVDANSLQGQLQKEDKAAALKLGMAPSSTMPCP